MSDRTSDATISIGEFARASGLTAKALRLYDEMGLLVPIEVDPATGYRRYAVEQLGRARLVARLRLAGLPLARIRVVADLPPRAAAAELTSYGRQVVADAGSTRRLVADLVAELTSEEQQMTTRTRPTGRAHAASYLEQGAREKQQDAVLVGEGVHAVADGFGQAVGVAETVLAELAGLDVTGPTDLVGALDAAVTRAAAVVGDGRYAAHTDAGTTLTALALGEGQAVLAHIGDARAYLVRAGRLERLTRDHSVVQTLVDEGRLTAEEARVDDRRVQLNRAIAVDASDVPDLPDLAVHAVHPGDRIVLATDGVHGRLDPGALTELLVADADPEDVVAAVRAAVEKAGADDNHALVVVDLR